MHKICTPPATLSRHILPPHYITDYFYCWSPQQYLTMPIAWTAEVDQRVSSQILSLPTAFADTMVKLFMATLEVCGLVINNEQYEQIAEHMGEGEKALWAFSLYHVLTSTRGFTRYSIQHRFRNIKKKLGNTNGASPTKGKTTTSKVSKTAPRKNKKNGNGVDDDPAQTPRAASRKRPPQSYDEPPSDDDEEVKEPESPTKKLKREQVDEEEEFTDYDALASQAFHEEV